MFDGAKTNDLGEATGTADAAPRWKVIDRQLRTIAKRRGALDCDEAILLCEVSRHEVWRRVGYASLFEYLEEVLGYGPKTARERIRIATALDEMPELATALASGQLSYSAVRELTRVATRGTEHEWIDAVRGKNLRQVEELVGKHQTDDWPSDPEDPSLAPRVVSFRVRPATAGVVAPGPAPARRRARRPARRRCADRGAVQRGGRAQRCRGSRSCEVSDPSDDLPVVRTRRSARPSRRATRAVRRATHRSRSARDARHLAEDAALRVSSRRREMRNAGLSLEALPRRPSHHHARRRRYSRRREPGRAVQPASPRAARRKSRRSRRSRKRDIRSPSRAGWSNAQSQPQRWKT